MAVIEFSESIRVRVRALGKTPPLHSSLLVTAKLLLHWWQLFCILARQSALETLRAIKQVCRSWLANSVNKMPQNMNIHLLAKLSDIATSFSLSSNTVLPPHLGQNLTDSKNCSNLQRHHFCKEKSSTKSCTWRVTETAGRSVWYFLKFIRFLHATKMTVFSLFYFIFERALGSAQIMLIKKCIYIHKRMYAFSLPYWNREQSWKQAGRPLLGADSPSHQMWAGRLATAQPSPAGNASTHMTGCWGFLLVTEIPAWAKPHHSNLPSLLTLHPTFFPQKYQKQLVPVMKKTCI